jgi:hypothetical protein
VHAAEWSLSPTFTFSLDHDSNRYLQPDGEGSEATAMSLDLQMKYATERLTLALHPQASFQRFSSAEYPDTHDLALAGVAGYATERSTFSLSGLLSDQSLGTTELPLTGIVQPGTSRHDEDANVSWSYAQSERFALTLQGGYSHADYTSDIGNALALESYEGTNVAATEQFQYSDRLATFATLSGGSYTQQGITSPTRTYGLVAGVKLQFSERTSLSMDAGGSRTDFLSLTSNGFLGDLTLSRTTETGSISFAASRNVAPAGFGEITQQDTLKFSLHRDLTARLSGDLGASVFRYSSVFSIPGLISVDLGYLDRTYSQVAAGFGYQLTPTWTVALHALGTRVNGQTVPTSDDWQVRLDASWSPHGLTISR